ncbi:hypothetical protein PBRA_001287, partial [Plasmodiophora brassicae]
LFLILPPIMIYLSRPFSRFITPDINIVWLLLTVVGLGSGYFHATLSYSGQLIDELAILWVVAAVVMIASPKNLMNNRILNGSRLRLKIIMTIVTIVSSGLMFAAPVLNAFLLLSLCIPALAFFVNKVQSATSWRVVRLIFLSTFWWLLAITCWVNDRVFCKIWTELGVPYPQLHALWHLLVSVCSYAFIIVAAYYMALEERPELHPRIAYWPIDTFEFGIVYVEFVNDPITVMDKDD